MLKEQPHKRPNIYEVVREVCLMRGKEVPIKDVSIHLLSWRCAESYFACFRSIPAALSQKLVDTKNCRLHRQNHPGWERYSPHRFRRLRLPSLRLLLCGVDVRRNRMVPRIILPNRVLPRSAALQTPLQCWIEVETSPGAQQTSYQTDSLRSINLIFCMKREGSSTLSQVRLRKRRMAISRRNSPMLWLMTPLPNARFLRMDNPANLWSTDDLKLRQSPQNQLSSQAISGKNFLDNRHLYTSPFLRNLRWYLLAL